MGIVGVRVSVLWSLVSLVVDCGSCGGVECLLVVLVA